MLKIFGVINIWFGDVVQNEPGKVATQGDSLTIRQLRHKFLIIIIKISLEAVIGSCFEAKLLMPQVLLAF